MSSGKRQYFVQAGVRLAVWRAVFGLRAEARSNALAYLWWVIEPAILIMTFYFVFATILRPDSPDFLMFLVIGVTYWSWFAKSVQNASSAIYDARYLLNQVRIQRWVFPLGVLLQDFIKQLPVILMVLALSIFTRSSDSELLFLPLCVLAQFSLILGISFFFSSLVPLLPDLRLVIQLGILVLMFASGVFFDLRVLGADTLVAQLAALNPMAVLLNFLRDVHFVSNQLESIWPLLYVATVGLVFTLLGLVTMVRFDARYTRTL